LKRGGNKIYAFVCANIWGYMKAEGKNIDDLAAWTGRVAPSTMYQRLREPENFRLSELIAIADKMGMTVSELIGDRRNNNV